MKNKAEGVAMVGMRGLALAGLGTLLALISGCSGADRRLGQGPGAAPGVSPRTGGWTAQQGVPSRSTDPFSPRGGIGDGAGPFSFRSGGRATGPDSPSALRRPESRGPQSQVMLASAALPPQAAEREAEGEGLPTLPLALCVNMAPERNAPGPVQSPGPLPRAERLVSLETPFQAPGAPGRRQAEPMPEPIEADDRPTPRPPTRLDPARPVRIEGRTRVRPLAEPMPEPVETAFASPGSLPTPSVPAPTPEPVTPAEPARATALETPEPAKEPQDTPAERAEPKPEPSRPAPQAESAPQADAHSEARPQQGALNELDLRFPGRPRLARQAPRRPATAPPDPAVRAASSTAAVRAPASTLPANPILADRPMSDLFPPSYGIRPTPVHSGSGIVPAAAEATRVEEPSRRTSWRPRLFRRLRQAVAGPGQSSARGDAGHLSQDR